MTSTRDALNTFTGAAALVATMTGSPGFAQDNTMEAPLLEETVAFSLDSGPIVNDSTRRRVVYSAVVQWPDAPWVRVVFQRAELGHPPVGGEATVLRVTSLLDDAVQILDRQQLMHWRNTSAYFNGDAVLLEVVADPGAQPSLLVVDGFQAGLTPDGGPATICGEDDRVLSSDRRAARLVPIGCTVWLFNDANSCYLTAGHCGAGAGDVVEFNVPLSTAGGEIVHPGPEDQYPVDPASVQAQNSGTGNDWGYFGCLPNSNTGLFPYEAQGERYEIAAAAPENAGQTVTITGFGVDDSPLAWTQVQQTHSEAYAGVDGTRVFYTVDTRGGNSGSAVLDESTGMVIGIHTHGGCGASSGSNSGTAINHPSLQQALAAPQGVCIPFAPIAIALPDGIPDLIDPLGQVIRVEVAGTDDGSPQPGTGQLHYRIDGGAEMVVDMTVVADNVYDAVFPAFDCAAAISYWFTAESTDGQVAYMPFTAPDGPFESFAGDGYDFVYLEDFETDTGWTVINDPALVAGEWQHGCRRFRAVLGDRNR
ncbi:MAG: trypsin-like serine peptidase [Planctomycetota bacterium]|jgi:hypothetical protein